MGLIIERIDLDQQGYIINSLKQETLRLISKHKDFVLAFGGLIFGQELDDSMSLANVLKISKVYDETSVLIIISHIKSLPTHSEIMIDDHDTYDYDHNGIYFKVKNHYAIGDLNVFVDFFKGALFGLKTISLNEFVNSTISKLITRDEFKDIIGLRKRM